MSTLSSYNDVIISNFLKVLFFSTEFGCQDNQINYFANDSKFQKNEIYRPEQKRDYWQIK